MGWINHSFVIFTIITILIACTPKKEGADTRIWTVTAQNGDTMTGCLAEDVTPDVVGYLDIQTLPNFDIETFENLVFDVDDWFAAGKKGIRSGLANITNVNHPAGLRWTHEDKVKHCGSYPPPQGTEEWYFSQHISGLSVQYRLFSLGDKMVFIDARTREDKPKKKWVPNVHSE